MRIAVNVIPRLGKVDVTVKKDYEIIKIAVENRNYTVYRDKNHDYFLLPQSKKLKVKSPPSNSWDNIFIHEDAIDVVLTRFDTGEYSISYTLYRSK